MPEVLWAAGTVTTVCVTLATIVFIWVRTLQKRLDDHLQTLPLDYYPRGQLEVRIRELRDTLHSHMMGMETRSNERFDKLERFLERIENRLESKQDKTP